MSKLSVFRRALVIAKAVNNLLVSISDCKSSSGKAKPNNSQIKPRLKLKFGDGVQLLRIYTERTTDQVAFQYDITYADYIDEYGRTVKRQPILTQT